MDFSVNHAYYESKIQSFAKLPLSVINLKRMEKEALLSLMLILCLDSVDWIVKNLFSMYAVTKKKTSRQHGSLKDSKLNWIFLISEDMFGKYNNMHNNIRFKKNWILTFYL